MRDMKRRMKHPYLYAILFSICLVIYTSFTVLKAFVIQSDVVSANRVMTYGKSSSTSTDSAHDADRRLQMRWSSWKVALWRKYSRA